MFTSLRLYREFDRSAQGGETTVAWASEALEDTCWDQFLQATPLGQFQQSTIWVRAKVCAGWKPVRVVLTQRDEIVGGFQVLWKPFWGLRIGYVTRGPVVLPEFSSAREYATTLLRRLAHTEKLTVLVVQPPDLCEQMPQFLAEQGFVREGSGRVNSATWLIDLREGFEAVTRRMGSSTRRRARQAVARDVKIREGGRQDLPTFFDLMLSSCRRQKVRPNPQNISELLALWDAAHPVGAIRLWFAEHEGKPLTGYLFIGFGKTFTAWKKGWTSTDGHRSPNDLSIYESLKWASQSGYDFYDFSAFDRQMGKAIIKGEPLSRQQARSRYMFLTRFGGSPRLLPETRVYIPNPVIRFAYRVFFGQGITPARTGFPFDREPANQSTGLKLAEGGSPEVQTPHVREAIPHERSGDPGTTI